MPHWTPEPPAPDQSLPLRLTRVPMKGQLHGIATSTELIGCNTHYARNRTIPCEGPGQCDACADGFSFRWHCYLSIILTPGWEHVLLELTAAASDPLRNYVAIHSEIRGCDITATRPSGRQNGRVQLQARPANLAGIRLPDPPNLQRILCHVWGVKYSPPPTPTYDARKVLESVIHPADDDARYHVNQNREPGNGQQHKGD